MIAPAVGSAGVRLLFVDTETTGLTVTDKPVGVSYELPTGESAYLRWGHRLGGNTCELSQVQEWWNVEVAGYDVLVVHHNAVFDARMLLSVGCRLPRRLEDTCVIAALLNEHEPSYRLEELAKKHLGPEHVKASDDLNEYCRDVLKARKGHEAEKYHEAPGDLVEPYARQDVHLTRLLYLALRPRLDAEDLGKVHALESSLIPVLVRMYRAGVRVDTERAEELKVQLLAENAQAHAQLTEINGGEPINVESTAQLVGLFRRLNLPTAFTPKLQKLRKKTGEEYTSGGNPSVNKEFLKTLEHPVARCILAARRTHHYSNVFIDSYIFGNVTPHGFIHPSFHQARSAFGGARTGRFSSAGGLNAQNIPKRDEEWGPKIRGLFIPAYDGGQWLRSDYSQIEYRYFAHYAGGAVMQRYIAEPDVDFHEMVAELTGLKRSVAKNTNFGILFGMGARKMAVQTGLPPDEAAAALATYHELIPEARLLATRAGNKAAARGYIVTWGGRRCRFLKQHGHYIYTHKALNYLTQGSSADLIKTAMVAVDAAINWEDVIMHLTVHDELDFTVPPGEDGARAGWLVKEVMEAAGVLRVPVKADAEIGPSWGDCGALPQLAQDVAAAS